MCISAAKSHFIFCSRNPNPAWEPRAHSQVVSPRDEPERRVDHRPGPASRRPTWNIFRQPSQNYAKRQLPQKYTFYLAKRLVSKIECRLGARAAKTFLQTYRFVHAKPLLLSRSPRLKKPHPGQKYTHRIWVHLSDQPSAGLGGRPLPAASF